MPSVLIMLALISFLIIVHEMGHYFVARACGVRVERFGFGLPMGPKLWSQKVGDTEFCLHPLLFGGYVAFPDDNPDSDIPEDSPERFENRPVWQRAAIASAGVAVNAVVGWGMMTIILLVWGLSTLDVAVMDTTSPTSRAALAGMSGPSLIQQINGKPIKGFFGEERLKGVVDEINQHPEQPMTFTLETLAVDPKTKASSVHTGQFKTLTVTPDSGGKIGIRLGAVEKTIAVQNPLEASVLSARFLSNFVVMNFQALGKMLTGHLDTRQLSGPISIVSVGAKLIDDGGIQKGLILTSIISVILAVMNLLPIPALDGGHLLFILIEGLRGKPVKKVIQERFMQAGFVGLVALMGFVLWNDVYNTWIHPVISH